jgi:hypothetical protein
VRVEERHTIQEGEQGREREQEREQEGRQDRARDVKREKEREREREREQGGVRRKQGGALMSVIEVDDTRAWHGPMSDGQLAVAGITPAALRQGEMMSHRPWPMARGPWPVARRPLPIGQGPQHAARSPQPIAHSTRPTAHRPWQTAHRPIGPSAHRPSPVTTVL